MKIEVTFTMGLSGCKRKDIIEIPDEELDGLDPVAREAEIELNAREWMHNFIDLSWEEASKP